MIWLNISDQTSLDQCTHNLFNKFANTPTTNSLPSDKQLFMVLVWPLRTEEQLSFRYKLNALLESWTLSTTKCCKELKRRKPRLLNTDMLETMPSPLSVRFSNSKELMLIQEAWFHNTWTPYLSLTTWKKLNPPTSSLLSVFSNHQSPSLVLPTRD